MMAWKGPPDSYLAVLNHCKDGTDKEQKRFPHVPEVFIFLYPVYSEGVFELSAALNSKPKLAPGKTWYLL